jgi:hypothetical protein
MNKFASIAVIAASASAVELTAGPISGTDYTTILQDGHTKTYPAEFDMLPDEIKMMAMKQGEGRDHTDWSWNLEEQEEDAKVTHAATDLHKAKEG